MDPVSNADRLVQILRQRLQARERSGRIDKAARRSSASPSGPTGVQALAAVDGVDDRLMRRALIQDILTDQFGAELVNERKFQELVDRVTAALEDDAHGALLLQRMVDEVRGTAGQG